MLTIRIHTIIPRSYADGPGERTVLLMPDGDQAGREEEIADVAQAILLLAYSNQVTIAGGEPFDQPEALHELLCMLRRKGIRHVIVFTGCAWGQLYPRYTNTLALIDVVIEVHSSLTSAWIDAPATLSRGSLTPVLLAGVTVSQKV